MCIRDRVTIYRLFERDMCLFSASCMMNSIQFDISIEAEKDTELWVIPTEVYKKLMDDSMAVASYTNQLMATRFSEVCLLYTSLRPVFSQAVLSGRYGRCRSGAAYNPPRG